jgi:hypothetical protein
MPIFDISSGGDFTEPSDWIADAAANRPTLSEDEIGEVTGHITEAATLHFTGIDTNGQRMTLRAAAGQSFSGNPLRANSSNGAMLTLQGGPGLDVDIDNVTIDLLQLRHTGGFSEGLRARDFDGGSDFEFFRSLLESAGGSANSYIAHVSGGVYRGGLFVNAADIDTAGLRNAGNTLIEKFGIINIATSTGAFGVSSSFGALTGENVAVLGWAGGDGTTSDGGSIAGTHWATDKSAGTTALPATGRAVDVVLADEYEDVAGADYDLRLKSTAPDLRDAGTGTDTDILGNAVSNSVADIGHFEFQAGGGTADVAPSDVAVTITVTQPTVQQVMQIEPDDVLVPITLSTPDVEQTGGTPNLDVDDVLVPITLSAATVEAVPPVDLDVSDVVVLITVTAPGVSYQAPGPTFPSGTRFVGMIASPGRLLGR